ncbi:D-alanine--D-alanine ligase [Microlunatus phosphovorus NM-1]|uniref:D-alanine--D-alanine ligase n=1 Tax=Microlunatus phosphovorus (strain ATCC 700054 / DSM 10555 / JCM 9379 / NBRC 101784 / NCIMB 13414 / VKM Ac-1990 / NM-1) TaxID=1032480 RepID=F5XDU1_MICPN|nr:D-alanine--D-alanine ligase family protein [Microlunatus phosphovorus]BAK35114.1 D-alanine--D-alanine ligase [Microlunatus phosphovorus NM-1]
MTDSPTIRPRNVRPRVAVVFGGTSSEHAISCLTAGSVLNAIDRDRYEVVAIGIAPSGRWVVVPDDLAGQMQVIDGVLPSLSEELLDAIWLRTAGGSDLAIAADPRGSMDSDESGTLLTADDASTGESALSRLGSVDVAFALLHGPFGEDGTIQGMFEMMGTRYVGAGVLASAVGMDKTYMKVVLAAAGLPVGPFVSILPREWSRDRSACLEAVAALHRPLYVKPARGGSSLGITRVGEGDDLVAAVEHAQQFDPKVIVEEGFVDARELECGVLGGLAGADPEASQVAEIRVHTDSGFYDFDAKYLPEEQVDLDVPADVDADIAEEVRRLAVRTFEAIGCEGLARVDVFVTRDRKVYVNEINTMPGFTALSMFPRMWAASGMAYPELVDRLLQLAMERPVGLR